MSEGLVPMFSGPVTIMREVIEKMVEAYPSNLFVKRDEYDRLFQEKWELEQKKNAEIKKWEERFDKALDGVLRAPQPPVGELNFSPIMATLESTGDDLPVLEPNGTTALVDTLSFGWRDLVALWFYVVVGSGMVFMAGRAIRWW
ncbi:MAG TPA: hypothetical protein VK175_06375 [Leadbetterella sp.]|nr:hypothetical protein [Leadbetterella sp.]